MTMVLVEKSLGVVGKKQAREVFIKFFNDTFKCLPRQGKSLVTVSLNAALAIGKKDIKISNVGNGGYEIFVISGVIQ